MQGAHVTASQTQTNGAPTVSDFTLDALARRSYDALAVLYRKAHRPITMYAIDGFPKGRVLAPRLLDKTPLLPLLRAFAASSSFPWDGKSFTASADDEGTGVNRIKVPGVLGRQNLFPFHTHFGPSAIDGDPALILDYELPENPIWVAKIQDEVREISPGIFFGPAMYKARSGPVTLLWFGLDTGRRI